MQLVIAVAAKESCSTAQEAACSATAIEQKKQEVMIFSLLLFLFFGGQGR